MELYFNLFKVKYEKLMELLRQDETVNISTRDTVNIFINLESLFINMTNPKVKDYLVVNQKSSTIQFIACVINLAAHYRWFFTKNKIKSKVYLYFPTLSTAEYKNRLFDKDYRRYYDYKFKEDVQNSLVYKTITSSIPIINMILEYIEGVYFIDSHNIENSVIPYIIRESEKDESVNFIVSNSFYDFQYVNYGFKIIVPRRDESALINQYNAIDYIANFHNCNGTYTFSSKFLPFILSLVGNKNRNIYNIKGVQFKSAYKLIQTAFDKKMLGNESTNIHMLINIVKPAWRDIISINYYCTDIIYQYNQLNSKDIHDILSQMTDKFDNASLRKINDKYFTQFPIMLMEITAIPSGKRNVNF